MSRKKTQIQDLFTMVEIDDNNVVETSHQNENNVGLLKEEKQIKEETVEDKNDIDTKENTFDEMKQNEYKHYSVEEVKEATIKYFGGDQLAADVWMNKYALKDSDGNIFELTPDDMHHRIASEIARIEKRYPNPMTEEEVFEVLKDFRYIV